MATKIIMDSCTQALKSDKEDEVLNTLSTSTVLGFNRGKAKFVMGFTTTQKIAENDGCLIVKKIIDDIIGC